MKLIVGLGNPGEKYEMSRHNVGFMATDKLAKKWNIKIEKSKFESLSGEMNGQHEKVSLVQPQTYMNLSGNSLRKWVDFYKLNPKDDILVVYDDLDLPLGKIRLRLKGSSGGHNGIKSIIENLGTDQFCRIKVGIGRPENQDIVNYVLSSFTIHERELVNDTLTTVSNILSEWVTTPFQTLMNNYNSK